MPSSQIMRSEVGKMLKKKSVSLLLGAALLFTLVPSTAVAQTRAKAVEGGHALNDAPVKPKADLKTVFAREIAGAKARASGLDYERPAQDQQDQTTQQKPKKGWSKREKVALILVIGAVLAVTTLLLIHGIDTGPNCLEDIFDPRCNE